MTPRQTAVAAAVDLKWLTNSAALLRRRLKYTKEAARWWGLVRIFVDLGLTLKSAAAKATAALSTHKARPSTSLPAFHFPLLAQIALDMPLYDSIFLANLSRALNHETPRRRGRVASTIRDAIQNARKYGIDIGLLKSALDRTPAERLAILDANVEFVRGARRIK